MSVPFPTRPLDHPTPADHRLPHAVPITRTHADEENLLSFVAESSKDAVISVGGLHWVNDLPGSSSLPSKLTSSLHTDTARHLRHSQASSTRSSAS